MDHNHTDNEVTTGRHLIRPKLTTQGLTTRGPDRSPHLA